MCANWNILTSLESPDFDPYHVFEVDHDSCQVLLVTVLRGDNITMGKTRDLLDTPDPYVVLSVPGTYGSHQRTRCIDNCIEPVWDQQFEFLYDSELNRILKISLVDANVMVDYIIGVSNVDISDIKLEEEVQIKVTFNELSSVHLLLKRTTNTSSDLRYSLALCEDEKQFRRDRRLRCMKAMNDCFGEEADLTNPLKVPVVAMLGSGGGFRAMIGLSGVYKALKDSGIFGMCMYLAGLSGSTWFLSQLYTDQRFPDLPSDEVVAYFRKHSGVGMLSHLSPQSLMRYINRLVGKSVLGQPISFTDFFGLLLADTLVENKEATLTSMQAVVKAAVAPMPLFTSLHVKKRVSAKVFQEWVEFTPFEVGIPKYGTFMDASKFGSRFFKGKITKPFPEYPLHFLQGIWGSAFTILFKRLVHKTEGEPKFLDDESTIQNMRDLEESVDDGDIDDDDDDDDVMVCQEEDAEESNSQASMKSKHFWKKGKTVHEEALAEKKRSLWQDMVQGLMSSSMLNSRAGRAGAVFNPLYGLRMLSLQPLSPFTAAAQADKANDADFAQIHEMMDTTSQRLLLVDAGLTFNSPYPVLLRPQRGVDLYISFDFSGRKDDDKDLFMELELAETWARKNQLPFPPVAEQARQYEKEPVREVYVFRGEDCPTILHFVLINTSFKKFKAPGVPRTTKEELEFGNFNVFSGGEQAFGTLNFQYDQLSFDRLSQLTEYNTLLHIGLVRAEILRAIHTKRLATRMSLKDIVHMKMLSQQSKDSFISLVRNMQGTGGESAATIDGGARSDGADDDVPATSADATAPSTSTLAPSTSTSAPSTSTSAPSTSTSADASAPSTSSGLRSSLSRLGRMLKGKK